MLLKKIFPKSILTLARKTRNALYKISDEFKPYLNKIKYQNYYVYYTKGNGLIQRIRFGNTSRTYEEKLSNLIINELNKNKNYNFLDIGANIGLISLNIIAKINGIKIYAFEPGFKQYFLFKMTIFANRLENNIKLYNKAVSDKIDKIKFSIHNSINNSGDGIIDTKRGGPTKEIEVDSITLDNWWIKNNKPIIKVIKIDTEDSELLILKGAEQFINNCKPTIFLEISLLNLKVYPYKPIDYLTWSKENNYQIFNEDWQKCDENNFQSYLEKNDLFIMKPNI